MHGLLFGPLPPPCSCHWRSFPGWRSRLCWRSPFVVVDPSRQSPVVAQCVVHFLCLHSYRSCDLPWYTDFCGGISLPPLPRMPPACFNSRTIQVAHGSTGSWKRYTGTLRPGIWICGSFDTHRSVPPPIGIPPASHSGSTVRFAELLFSEKEADRHAREPPMLPHAIFEETHIRGAYVLRQITIKGE